MEKNYLHFYFKFTAIALLFLNCTKFGKAVRGPSPALGKGTWQLLLNNTGIVAMHMALTHYNTVIMFDQIESGQSGYRLSHRHNGTRCRDTREDLEDSSCYAHSVEYDVLRNKIRPLHIETDAWSSSGSFLSNGTLIQTGGFGHGARRIRYLEPCAHGRNCDWKQRKRLLSDDRWYASNQILPGHDQIIVVGGRRVFSYEFVPRLPSNRFKSYDLPFLHNTYDKSEGGNNLYPIIHLSSDGHLFIFANRNSILFNYKINKVAKTFPRIPGNGSRSYPSTGSSVILPLSHTDRFERVEVMICGGAASDAFSAAQHGRFLPGLTSCGRMEITGNKHEWKMENMPEPRLMSDMLILPTGDVLIINGVKNGSAGRNLAANPSLQPYLYKPRKPFGRRFSVLRSTKIARMYHSSAVLLPNGRILVAGSNPNSRYIFRNVPHQTELRLQASCHIMECQQNSFLVTRRDVFSRKASKRAHLHVHYQEKHMQMPRLSTTKHLQYMFSSSLFLLRKAFVPDHMDKKFDKSRPHNVSIYSNGNDGVGHGKEFSVHFLLRNKRPRNVVFTAYAPPFTTHSISMNQRMLTLRCRNLVRAANGLINARLEAPPNPNVAPPGYYMLTVVNDGIPSVSQWVRFIHA